MLKIINISILILLCTFLRIEAQQDAQYTQWMFNKLSLNSGYAASEDDVCFSALHRSQWVGIEGAPRNQSFNARVPFRGRNIALGLSVNHDAVGPTNSWTVSGIYAYKFDFGQGRKLSAGLRATARSYRINFSETSAITSGDGGIPATDQTQTIPNFGAGLYYYTSKYYIGFSAPRLLGNRLIYFNELSENSDFSREEVHTYLMAGAVLTLNSKLKLKPSILFKYVKDAPIDLDIHTSIIFYDIFWAGLTYRFGGFEGSIGESIDLVLQLQVNKKIRAGFAYDYSLTKIRDTSSGTFELVLDYCLKSDDTNLTNPRFF